MVDTAVNSTVLAVLDYILANANTERLIVIMMTS